MQFYTDANCGGSGYSCDEFSINKCSIHQIRKPTRKKIRGESLKTDLQNEAPDVVVK